jgi:hypothetical protein
MIEFTGVLCESHCLFIKTAFIAHILFLPVYCVKAIVYLSKLFLLPISFFLPVYCVKAIVYLSKLFLLPISIFSKQYIDMPNPLKQTCGNKGTAMRPSFIWAPIGEKHPRPLFCQHYLGHSSESSGDPTYAKLVRPWPRPGRQSLLGLLSYISRTHPHLHSHSHRSALPLSRPFNDL